MRSYRKPIPRTKTGIKTRVEREHDSKERAEVAAYHKRMQELREELKRLREEEA